MKGQIVKILNMAAKVAEFEKNWWKQRINKQKKIKIHKRIKNKRTKERTKE